jgi:quinol monooxygenase YgiN
VQQQFGVTYVEFKPADTNAGVQMLEKLAANAEASSGVVSFEVLQQIDRPNFFALFEVWTTAQGFSDFQNSSATQAILLELSNILEGPARSTVGQSARRYCVYWQSTRDDESNICNHTRG